jgi:nicotinate-nucleotide adenylyltransferase
MIEMVCAEHPLFYPEPREIDRAEPTYSVDTFTSFRNELPNTPLCFFIGTDSLINFTSWYKWKKLLTLCHLVVCNRAGFTDLPKLVDPTKDSCLQKLLAETQTYNPQDLHTNLAGRIFLADTPTITISSSELRKQLIQPQKGNDYIPVNVLAYIRQHKLYQHREDFC